MIPRAPAADLPVCCAIGEENAALSERGDEQACPQALECQRPGIAVEVDAGEDSVVGCVYGGDGASGIAEIDPVVPAS